MRSRHPASSPLSCPDPSGPPRIAHSALIVAVSDRSGPEGRVDRE